MNRFIPFIGTVLLAIIVCLLFFIGTGHSAPMRYTMNVGADVRSFYMELPTAYSSRKCRNTTCSFPVIVMLHGGTSDGLSIAGQTKLSSQTRDAGIIAVYPNALPINGETAWNDGRTYTSSGPNDVAFLNLLVDTIVYYYGHDASRVYLGGSSNGGIMTLRAMCELTGKFRAYTVAIAGQAADLNCAPAGQAPLNIYASTTDPLMPFNGGQVAGQRGLVWSNQQTVDYWAGKNGCTGAPVTTTLPILVNDGTYIVYSAYSCGRVNRYQVVGGGHAWPDGTQDARFGITTRNLDGTKTMMAFFRRFGL